MAKYVFHLIRSLGTTKELHLVAQFDDGTIKSYDISKLSNKNNAFKEFESNPILFSKAKIDAGGYGVVWNESLDLSANEIWANGKTIDNAFNGLMSFGDACRIWELNESTLRKALSYGKLKAGIDCCKYGKQWVVTSDAMLREYGTPDIELTREGNFSWDNLVAAESSSTYGVKKKE